jgi:hypothetical protein
MLIQRSCRAAQCAFSARVDLMPTPAPGRKYREHVSCACLTEGAERVTELTILASQRFDSRDITEQSRYSRPGTQSSGSSAARSLYVFRTKSLVQFVSQVAPPSAELACSQRADRGVIRDHCTRVLIGRPLNVSSPTKTPTPFANPPRRGGAITDGSRPSSHQLNHCRVAGS